MDDGSSFAYKKGNYLKSEFTFSKSKLKAKATLVDSYGPVDQSAEKPYNTRIERIVFIGLKKEPDTIEFSGKELVFITRKSSQAEYIVTVKNPNMHIGDDFELILS